MGRTDGRTALFVLPLYLAGACGGRGPRVGRALLFGQTPARKTVSKNLGILQSMWFKKRGRKKTPEIYPDEILIDSKNVSEFDTDQFEGRIERPLSRRSLALAGGALATLALMLLLRAGDLQVINGTAYA